MGSKEREEEKNGEAKKANYKDEVASRPKRKGEGSSTQKKDTKGRKTWVGCCKL